MVKGILGAGAAAKGAGDCFFGWLPQGPRIGLHADAEETLIPRLVRHVPCPPF